MKSNAHLKICSIKISVVDLTRHQINEPIRGPKIKVKKSIFIASIYPLSDEAQIAGCLEGMKREFSKASHNAYAFVLMENEKIRSDFHDDGEVKGTAGRVILQNLERKSLVNVLLVVTRFYGGINLGKGGLIRAYSEAAYDLLENINIEPYK
ncbi:MAG: YigZ family protein [Candidatus Heimdallarchaeota archaeon]|nr:YigZ family protein [Candidatus Heimdallarchaeota archaeon]